MYAIFPRYTLELSQEQILSSPQCFSVAAYWFSINSGTERTVRVTSVLGAPPEQLKLTDGHDHIDKLWLTHHEHLTGQRVHQVRHRWALVCFSVSLVRLCLPWRWCCICGFSPGWHSERKKIYITLLCALKSPGFALGSRWMEPSQSHWFKEGIGIHPREQSTGKQLLHYTCYDVQFFGGCKQWVMRVVCYS